METRPRSVWLLSPYDTGSHHAWAEGYLAHTRHEVTLLAHGRPLLEVAHAGRRHRARRTGPHATR